MSAAALLRSGDSAAGGSWSLVLQAYRSLLDWLEGGRSVVVLGGLGGVALWLGLILVNFMTYLVLLQRDSWSWVQSGRVALMPESLERD